MVTTAAIAMIATVLTIEVSTSTQVWTPFGMGGIEHVHVTQSYASCM
jgi:hypothetical protein